MINALCADLSRNRRRGGVKDLFFDHMLALPGNVYGYARQNVQRMIGARIIDGEDCALRNAMAAGAHFKARRKPKAGCA